MDELGGSKAKLEKLTQGKAAAEEEKGVLLADLKRLEDKLGENLGKLQELEKDKAAVEEEKEKLLTTQQELKGDLVGSQDKLKNLIKGKAAVEGEKEKLLEDRKRTLDELLASKTRLKELEGSKRAVEDEKEKLLTAQQKLQKKLSDIEDKEKLRQDIIARLKENFDRYGSDAQINEDTGEVTLPFNEAYFGFDSALLKDEMKEYLEKIIPIYAKSIFDESNAYKFIKSIEVVGFASPIYKGKYVNPQSLSAEAQTALHYNMDLSYRRARSIFKYILDKQNLRYKHQKDLMVYLKVTGRSYLESSPLEKLPRDGIAKEEFCAQYDCDKFQSAIIRFNLVE